MRLPARVLVQEHRMGSSVAVVHPRPTPHGGVARVEARAGSAPLVVVSRVGQPGPVDWTGRELALDARNRPNRRTATSATAHIPPARRNGIQSPVPLAIAPPAAGPMTAPSAHAAFMKPNAIPCASLDCSAPSAISANAGVKRTPYALAAITTSGT